MDADIMLSFSDCSRSLSSSPSSPWTYRLRQRRASSCSCHAQVALSTISGVDACRAHASQHSNGVLTISILGFPTNSHLLLLGAGKSRFSILYHTHDFTHHLSHILNSRSPTLPRGSLWLRLRFAARASSRPYPWGKKFQFSQKIPRLRTR